MLVPGNHSVPDPVLGTPVISMKTLGGCGGGAGAATHDILQGDWTLTGFNPIYHSISATLSGGAPNNPGAITGNTHVQWTAPGSELADTGSTVVAWVLRVQVRRLSDGIVVQDKSSATWNDTFFSTCSSRH